MRVRLVRRPGQHGTGPYVEQYGDRLVCVRYRYDEAARRRYKTVEIIVDEAPWAPAAGAAAGAGAPPPPLALPAPGVGRAEEPRGGQEPPAAGGGAGRQAAGVEPDRGGPGLGASTLVGLRLPPGRPGLVEQVRLAGGVHRERLGVWAISYGAAAALGLHQYIVDTVEALAAEWNRRYTSTSRRP